MEGLPGDPVHRRRARRLARGGRRGRAVRGRLARRLPAVVRVLSADGRRRVLLLRHGRTGWNASGRFQGQLDVPLDDLGRAQAAAVAPVLAAERPVALLSSDSGRAWQTAEPLEALTGLTARRDPRLREIDLGAWTGLSREEALARFPGEYDAWSGGADIARGGGETYREVADRATAVIGEALADVGPGGLLVVVTHGGTSRATTGAMLDLDPAAWWRLAPLGNTCWATLVEARAGWRLAEHGARVREAPTAPEPAERPDPEGVAVGAP